MSSSSPREPAAVSKQAQWVFWLIVVVVGVGLVATWLIALGNVKGSIRVSLTNHTGKPLTDVTIASSPTDQAAARFARIASEESVSAKVRSTDKVVVRLRDGDRRQRQAEYPFASGAGLWHTMEITVEASSTDPGKFAQVGRKSEVSSSALFGTTARFAEPIDQFDDLASPAPR